MMRWLVLLTSVLAMAANAAPETKRADPKTLLFSLVTISDALPPTHPVNPQTTDLVLPEDDWRQLEAVSSSYLAEVNAELADIRRIFREKSKQLGEGRSFTEMHIRKRIPAPITAALSWDRLVAAAGISAASVADVALSGTGVVINGFSTRAGNLVIYGTRSGDAVQHLCFVVTSKPGVDENAATKLAAFFDENRLLLVHWPSATLLDTKAAILNFLRR
jgi:hypothetical protein